MPKPNMDDGQETPLLDGEGDDNAATETETKTPDVKQPELAVAKETIELASYPSTAYQDGPQQTCQSANKPGKIEFDDGGRLTETVDIDITTSTWQTLLNLKVRNKLHVPLIHLLLPRVTADVGNVRKGQWHGQKFKYRGIDDALNAISPILTRHGCHVTVRVLETKLKHTLTAKEDGFPRDDFHCTLMLEVAFYGPDGSVVINCVAGEGIDYGSDKATNKAMSAAMKYALFFGLIIPVHADEVDDPDSSAGAEREVVTQAKSLIRTQRSKAGIAKVRKRLEEATAFESAEKETLMLLVLDKEAQIEETGGNK